MKIEKIINKFNSLGYVLNESKDMTALSKGDISFDFIKQRWEGYDLYFSYKGGNFKLDWVFEIYLKEKNLEDIVENVGKISIDEGYYYDLIFNKAKFIVFQKVKQVEKFIDWYNTNSNFYYTEYLSLLKNKN
jgi:hypothetical protein